MDCGRASSAAQARSMALPEYRRIRLSVVTAGLLQNIHGRVYVRQTSVKLRTPIDEWTWLGKRPIFVPVWSTGSRFIKSRRVSSGVCAVHCRRERVMGAEKVSMAWRPVSL